MFNGKRFVTSGIAEKVPLELQMIMWDLMSVFTLYPVLESKIWK